MNKVKNILPSRVLLKIYNSLILSRLHYGILCWGFITKYIFKLQKKAVRTICRTKYNGHTDPLFKKLNLLKINDIFQTKCVYFYYNHLNNKLPAYFQSIFTPNIYTHSYNTRHRDCTHSVRPNKETTKKTIRYFIPQQISKLPEGIKSKLQTHSLLNIKQRTKKYFISSYRTHCNIPHCYVCSR